MLLQRFLKDRRAGVVPLFALSVIPVLGLIGAAVDYSRAATVRTALQNAADTTALKVAKSIGSSSATPSASSVQSQASTYFNATFARTEAQNLTVTTSYTNTGGSQLVVTGSATVNTMFLGILGITSMDVSASSTSKWGDTKLRVALVLDNTGSMSQSGKLTALKTATTNLLSQLQAAATTPGDVYVSIIPFVKDINVGPANYEADWIDFASWDSWSQNCASQYNPAYSDQRSTAASKCGGSFVNGGTQNKPVWTWQIDHSKWNGCLMDRDQNFDTQNTAPASSKLFPAEQYSNCPLALTAQTYDWTTLNNQVNAMVASGSTNQTIGLVWGWQSLTSTPPLNAPALDPNYKYEQVIILLSDGLNTQDRWYGNGSSTSTQVDTRMALACTNIKNANITIYTVQVNTDSSPTSTVLQNCASNSTGTYDHFFLLKTADQIVTTFKAIGNDLSKLRIAR